MNSQIANIVIILGMMQVAKKVPFEDPNVLNGVRAMYVLSNVIILSLYVYVSGQINKKNDNTTMKYLEPAQPLSGDQPKLVTTTIAAYDRDQLKAAFKSLLMGVGMMGVMHLYMKYTNPLLVQSIIPLKTAIESKLVQIHILGKPAIGDLKRPWKAGGMMPGMQGGDVVSDKKSIDEAERSGRGGAKEE
ncbi:inorganic phosphate transporter Pho88 [Tuber brumale]|nr:inorganic phosphate transporter Pho88 [Tuber brumale]